MNTIRTSSTSRFFSDVLGTVLLSVIGGLVLCGAARVPYVGIFLAGVLAIGCGIGLGYVELPVWSQATVTVLSLIGFFFGLKWQFETPLVSDIGVILGTCMGLCAFCCGFLWGERRADRENERDGRDFKDFKRGP